MFKPTILDIKNLYYKIAAHDIISGFSMRLSLGKIAILLGPSGCGKSSILNIIAGLKHASAGHFKMPNISISFVFQEPNLLPFYTAYENLRLCAANVSEQEIMKLLNLLNISPIDAQKYPSELSGGMKTRINLARAMLANPSLMLLDEPFTGINYELKEFLISFLIDFIKKQNKSALMVTHDRLEALKIADVIYILGERSQVQKVLELKTAQANRGEEFFSQYKDFLKVHYE